VIPSKFTSLLALFIRKKIAETIRSFKDVR